MIEDPNKDLKFKQNRNGQNAATKEAMNTTTRTVDTLKTRMNGVSKNRKLNLTFDQVQLFVNDMT